MKIEGNCFEAALRYLNRAMEENSPTTPIPEIILVHGQVFAKEWRVHAWIERDGMVIDVSNSNPDGRSLPVGEYYERMHVKNEKKYTHLQALLAQASSCDSTVPDPETTRTSPGPWDPLLLDALMRESENRNC